MVEKGKYLYCLIREKNQKEFNVLGIEGERVYTICQGGLSAVVSDAKVKEYPISRENTLTHQRVIEEVMNPHTKRAPTPKFGGEGRGHVAFGDKISKASPRYGVGVKEYDVLPVSFGTVTGSEKDLKEKILKPERKKILSALEKIKGKIELNLKAIWLNLPGIFQEIVKEDREIQAAKKEVSQVSGIVRTNFAIEVGKMVVSALERKKESEAADILKPLKKIAEDFKENKVQLDQIIFNSAFLVAKEKEKEFDGEVSKLGEKYDGRIKFIYVGPLPPFNFVELEFSLK